MRTSGQVHRLDEAGFSSFSEGTVSDFPGFASSIKVETMKRNRREETNLQKTRTKSTILPEHPRDDSHIRLDWVRARQSSKAQTLHM